MTDVEQSYRTIFATRRFRIDYRGLMRRFPATAGRVFADMMRKRQVPRRFRFYHFLTLWFMGTGRTRRYLVRWAAPVIARDITRLLIFGNLVLQRGGRGSATRAALASILNSIPIDRLDANETATCTAGPYPLREIIYRASSVSEADPERAAYYHDARYRRWYDVTTRDESRSVLMTL